MDIFIVGETSRIESFISYANIDKVRVSGDLEALRGVEPELNILSRNSTLFEMTLQGSPLQRNVELFVSKYFVCKLLFEHLDIIGI